MKKGTTWLNKCGGYRVRVGRDRRVHVWCRHCGPCGTFTSRNAKRLADELGGPLGRFQVDASRPERLRLVELLEAAAARAAALEQR